MQEGSDASSQTLVPVLGLLLGVISAVVGVVSVAAAPAPPLPPPLISPLELPDLTFTTSWHEDLDGTWYQATVVVNRGSVASPPTSIQIWADVGPFEHKLPALAPGAQYDVGLTAPLVACTAAAIDVAKSVAEAREDNNCVISWSDPCGKWPF
jgi:hypothetical protein